MSKSFSSAETVKGEISIPVKTVKDSNNHSFDIFKILLNKKLSVPPTNGSLMEEDIDSLIEQTQLIMKKLKSSNII